MDEIEVDEAAIEGLKIPGIPAAVTSRLNPKMLLPIIARQISDAMLEKFADFIVIVAKDIIAIRRMGTFHKIADDLILSPVTVETDETDEAEENETDGHFTEFQEERAV